MSCEAWSVVNVLLERRDGWVVLGAFQKYMNSEVSKRGEIMEPWEDNVALVYAWDMMI